LSRHDSSVQRTVDKGIWAVELEEDSWDSTAGTGQLEHDNWDRIAGNRTAGAGHQGQDSRDRTARAGMLGQEKWDRIVKGDSWDSTARISNRGRMTKT
jgi:hypothetical protein